MQTTQW